MALQTLSASDLRDPEISSLIAAKMREFHDLDMPGPKTPLLWERLRYGCLFLSDFLMKLDKVYVSTKIDIFEF